MRTAPAFAAAALAAATLSLGSPADAIVRNSVPTHLTSDAPATFPKAGYGSTFTVTITADNGQVPDNAYIRCDGTRAEGGFATQHAAGNFDTAGNAQVFFVTPAAGHWHWTCGAGSSYQWTIYQSSALTLDFAVTESGG